MAKQKRKGHTRPYHDLLMEQLQDPELALEYLNAALEEEDDPEAFLMALRHVAEAHGMSHIAKTAGLNRENCYRMLSKRGNPRLVNLYSLLRAMGLTLRVEKALSCTPSNSRN